MPEDVTGPRAAIERIVATALASASEQTPDDWMPDAQEILDALDQAGYVVVPGKWAREASANDND